MHGESWKQELQLKNPSTKVSALVITPHGKAHMPTFSLAQWIFNSLIPVGKSESIPTQE